MDNMMKECMRPHALMHTLTGVGLGFLLAAWIPSLYSSAVMVGVVLVLVGIVGDMMVQGKK